MGLEETGCMAQPNNSCDSKESEAQWTLKCCFLTVGAEHRAEKRMSVHEARDGSHLQLKPIAIRPLPLPWACYIRTMVPHFTRFYPYLFYCPLLTLLSSFIWEVFFTFS